MKVSTKNKILVMLKDNLAAARTRKAIAQKKLRSCEENIRWNKSTVKQNDNMISLMQAKAKTSKLACPMLDPCAMVAKTTMQNLKKDRMALKEIMIEIQRATLEIRKWNDFINEVSPYKK